MSNEELAVAIMAGDHSLMGELWSQIEKLVRWKAQRVITAMDLLGDSALCEFDDLVQSGYLALVNAVETFDPALGSFASWFMLYLKSAFAEATGYRTKQGRFERLADSLDRTLSDDEGSSAVGDLVPDINAAASLDNVDEAEFQKQLREALEAALSELPEKYGAVVRKRYLGCKSLAEAGAEIGVGTERVRQLEQKGLKMLRQPATAARLIEFYDFDYYAGAGLTSFKRSGLSIQEKYLIIEEDRKRRAEEAKRAELEEKYRKIVESRRNREPGSSS